MKEAAGDLTDDDDLRREGKAKDAVDDAGDKVKDALDRDLRQPEREAVDGKDQHPTVSCLGLEDLDVEVASAEHAHE